ncbi:transposase [Fructobacillus cardui]|uniref:transposase n=1 Tax=Fructobacillus cardui TaxID=2893170 RepID=UPI00200A16E8|nr:transposase [Fructobacillus cardui]MCK8628015.1 transposase [Fructobacillus cardui]
MSKLLKKDKINIYYLWKNQHHSSKRIAQKCKINYSHVSYLIALIEEHGLSVLDHSYQFHSNDLKLEIMRKALNSNRSIQSISLEYVLPSNGLLYNWLRSFRENGYTIVTKKKGRNPNDRSGERTVRSEKSQAQKRKPDLTREEVGLLLELFLPLVLFFAFDSFVQ